MLLGRHWRGGKRSAVRTLRGQMGGKGTEVGGGVVGVFFLVSDIRVGECEVCGGEGEGDVFVYGEFVSEPDGGGVGAGVEGGCD